MASQKQGIILGLSGLLFLNFLLFSSADVQSFQLFLQESEITKLCSTKSILTVNGSFPGPEIRVHKGDTVFVNVHNQGKNPVSMEWVGVKQSITGANELIQPGKNFTYKIKLSDEIGTLWYHGKSAWAIATVHGAFVVTPAAGEDYPFPAPDSDEIIILGSWFKQALTEANQTIAPGKADGYTINGNAGETYGCNDTSFVFQVDYESVLLLRVVNAAVNETIVFDIAHHSLTIIGQNGGYSRKAFTNSLRILPGQTVDVLFCANQNIGHYYITAGPSSGSHTSTGILKYTTTVTVTVTGF